MKSLLTIALLLIWAPSIVAAAQGTPDTDNENPDAFAIMDNSFLVEEAFNQDAGIFQNIFTWVHVPGGAWVGAFTQEWPAPNLAHQLSYTVPFGGGEEDAARVGDVVINYRYQLFTERPGRPAFSPRVSVILPTSGGADGNQTGLQFNLPFSKQFGDLYAHWNAGVTWLPGVSLDESTTTSLTIPLIAASLIWRTRPMLNLMMESTVLFDQSSDGARTSRTRIVTVSPGVRGGWNLKGDQQVVLGAAAPIIFDRSEATVAVLGYFSYELPFRRNR